MKCVLRTSFLSTVFLAAALVSAPAPAHATSKEIIELQSQVNQLVDMVQRLQSTMDAHIAVLQHLAEQTADNANRVTATVTAMQQKLNAQSEASNGKTDAISGQVQSLNDSVDELKSRIAKLDKSIQDMQTELQNVQNPAPGATPLGQTVPGSTLPAQTPSGPAATGPTPAVPAAVPATIPPAAHTAPSHPTQNHPTPAHPDTATLGQAAPPAAPAQPAAQAPPLQETFEAALRDYNAARYGIATSEFQDVISYYPLDDLAGTSHFYLGEIAYRQLRYSEAIKSFNAVLEGFPGNAKAPAAKLRKGLAMIEINNKPSGILQLRQLIQRYPQSPEAAQARTKLANLHVALR